MGRRSVHTPDELRELIIEASTALVVEGGYASLSAREIARRIEYSPGTLYNVFENLDQLILIIEGRVLDDLIRDLKEGPSLGDNRNEVVVLAERFLGFVKRQSKLWGVVCDHRVASASVPQWYRDKVQDIVGLLEGAVGRLHPSLSEDDRKKSARVLWFGMQGIVASSASGKLGGSEAGPDEPALVDFVSTYLSGLEPKSVGVRQKMAAG